VLRHLSLHNANIMVYIYIYSLKTFYMFSVVAPHVLI